MVNITGWGVYKIKTSGEGMNMTDGVYKRLARVLDTLPNGFPSTESGPALYGQAGEDTILQDAALGFWNL
jgi:hypothetical protein